MPHAILVSSPIKMFRDIRILVMQKWSNWCRLPYVCDIHVKGWSWPWLQEWPTKMIIVHRIRKLTSIKHKCKRLNCRTNIFLIFLVFCIKCVSFFPRLFVGCCVGYKYDDKGLEPHSIQYLICFDSFLAYCEFNENSSRNRELQATIQHFDIFRIFPNQCRIFQED